MKRYKTVQVNKTQVRLHRYIMECHLGRRLSTTELVHHRDGDINNNNIKNLEITTRAEHIKKHGTSGHKTFKYKINEKEVCERFKTQTIQSIADSYGCSFGTIGQIIYKKHHLKKPKVFCKICGDRAFYRKTLECKKHYLMRYAREHK